MSDQWEELTLSLRGDTYELVKRDESGTFSMIELSESNLLSLLPLIQRECAQLLENRSTPALKEHDAEPIVAMSVQGFAIHTDLLGSEIFLTLQEKNGNQYRFSFQAEGARTIGRRLIERSDELGAAAPSTKQ